MRHLIKISAIAAAACALTISPALADSKHGWHGGKGHHKHHYKHYKHYKHYDRHRHYSRSGVHFSFGWPVVRHRVVTHQYYPAPQPIYVQPANYQTAGNYCREYYGPVNIGGRIQQSYGTACLMPDGSWQIVD